MESANELWALVKEEIQKNTNEVIYEVWLKELELDSFDGARATLAIREFKRSIIEQQFFPVVTQAFETVVGFPVEVIMVEPAAGEEAPVAPAPSSINAEPNTFETFVVGPSNRFAHAAALAVAHEPAGDFNPLFIYGNSGLGKTHLLSAISHEFKKNHADADIIFTRGEDFVNLIVDGIRNNRMQEIHDKYRFADMLLVDDIQFIGGKTSTQEEFFHTFNALTQAGSQIVLTSDRPPKEIQTLDDRLRTRFESGLIADIQPPDIETRMAIIKRKAEALDFDLPNDVVQYIAEKIKSNIRQLEGAVKKIKAFATIQGASVNTATAQSAIKDILSDQRPIAVTVERIIQEVARNYGADPADIRSKKKDAPTSQMRQIAMYVIYEITDLSTTAIGVEFGGRDHSTVLYALKEMKTKLDKDSALKATVLDIIKNIQE